MSIQDENLNMLARRINHTVDVCHGEAFNAGWWSDCKTHELLDVEPLIPAKLLLIHSEVSEACEAHRKNLMDSHLPHRRGVEVELGDAVIRIFDLAGRMGLDLGSAIAEKLEYNRERADHKLAHRAGEHGKSY